MTCKVRWTRPALVDLNDAHAYLQERNRVAARRFAAEVRAAIARLRQHPRIGPRLEAAPIPGEIRSLVLGNHRVVYRLEAEVLTVLRFWDCQRDPDALWSRVARTGEDPSDG